MFTLQENPLRIQELQLTIPLSVTAGACVTFEGIVRADSKKNSTVSSLLYIADSLQCHDEGTMIMQEAISQFNLSYALCVQRIGNVPARESAIWIGAWSLHRDHAFQGCRYIIEQIKQRLHIWKKEFYIDGTSTWIHGHAR